MNQTHRLNSLLAVAIVASSTVTGCSSQSDTSSSSTTNYPTSVEPEPIPIQPQPSTFSQSQCSVDISEVLSKLQKTTRILDPIILRNSSIVPIEEGKLAWQQISTDPNCGRDKEQLRFTLQTCWQKYIGAAYNTGQILASSNRVLCTSGCSAFSDGSETCKAQCDESYQNELERLAREREIGDQEMNNFFH